MLLTYKDLPRDSSMELWTTDAGAYCQLFPPDPVPNSWARIEYPPLTNHRHIAVGTKIDGQKFLTYYTANPEVPVSKFPERAQVMLSNPLEPLFWLFGGTSSRSTTLTCYDGLWGNMKFRVFHMTVRDEFKSTIYKSVDMMNQYYAFAQDTLEGKNLLIRMRLLF